MAEREQMMAPAEVNWQVFPDAEAVAQAAVRRILDSAEHAIAAEGVFRIVLAGGTTPKRVYQLLTEQACNWSCWHIYLGDERCLPPDDSERNSVMIADNWLNNVTLPAANIHFIPAELGAEPAAVQYAACVEDALPFHLVLLGMGEDGHTASLFPGHVHDDRALVHAVHYAPKPPEDRVSLGQRCLSNTQALLIMVTGAGKKQAVQSWRAGVALPVASVTAHTQHDVLLDEAAAGGAVLAD